MIRLPVFSLAILSAAALAYELLLMRLFSIIHWHHFAYMVIGLALLGHGFSGSVVMLLQARLIKQFRFVYIGSILLFSLFVLLSFQVAQSLPFNAEEILWDWRQSFYLLSIFLLLSMPFFFVGAAICLTFLFFKQRLAYLYAADLLGAGVGSLVIIFLMFAVFPQSALLLVSVTGLFAAVVAGHELAVSKSALTTIVVVIAIGLFWHGAHMQLRISPYKSLQQMLLIKGTEVIAEKSSPLGMLSVVASEQIPFRYAPGMSLSSGSEPLPQLAVYSDAGNMGVITRKTDDNRDLVYLDQMTSALPYHLQSLDSVLIIGSGTGNDVLQAQFNRAGQIDAVEVNELLVELTSFEYGDFISDVYNQPGVSVHIADGRDFLTSRQQPYDLIQLSLLDSFNASAAGLYALNESYLYTVEALRLYLSRLQPGGYICITRWLKMPPRDTLKLFNTAVTILKGAGNAQQQLLLIRSWQTATLIIKNGFFDRKEIAAAEWFSQQRNFDLVYTPDIRSDQVNRFNVLRNPLFYQATQTLLSQDRQRFVEQYKFNLQPATDDRPYFQHFFRWSTLPEMLGLLHKGGASLVETGYLVIVVTLCIAVVVSVLLIVGPLVLLPKMHESMHGQVKRLPVLGYFFSIGLGFLMIEIAFMQKFILFLHHPVYAASAILTAFLVFAGGGSAYAGRLNKRYGQQGCVKVAILILACLSLGYLLILPPVFAWGSQLVIPLRFVISIALIAPLAFVMGMPMPLGLASLAEHAKNLIPWAWGINGCASVISSVLAALLAMHVGFSLLIVTAVILYIFAFMMFPQTNSPQ